MTGEQRFRTPQQIRHIGKELCQALVFSSIGASNAKLKRLQGVVIHHGSTCLSGFLAGWGFPQETVKALFGDFGLPCSCSCRGRPLRLHVRVVFLVPLCLARRDCSAIFFEATGTFPGVVCSKCGLLKVQRARCKGRCCIPIC